MQIKYVLVRQRREGRGENFAHVVVYARLPYARQRLAAYESYRRMGFGGRSRRDAD